jgi:hypothetical protein
MVRPRHGPIVIAIDDSPEQENDEMNGPMTTTARSVQVAVMTTPTTSLVEAVAEARRRRGVAAIAGTIRTIVNASLAPRTLNGSRAAA